MAEGGFSGFKVPLQGILGEGRGQRQKVGGVTAGRAIGCVLVANSPEVKRRGAVLWINPLLKVVPAA